MVFKLSKQNSEIIKKFRLAHFFNLWWDKYKKAPTAFIRDEQYKAVSAIRSCRTEALGIDHYVCEECGEISKVYHSCKNRFCPTCSWKDTLKWANKIEGQLFNIPHRHVVFTLPHSLNELVKANKGDLLDILFKTASDSLKDWMLHKHQLKPGIISVLHTAGEKKNLHPHIHMIISWGGVDHNYALKAIKGDYINYEFIQKKFRCKFEDKLVELFDNETLQHKFKTRIEFLRFIKKINKKQWHINLEPPMTVAAQVIRYIGRYSKRACLSEYKITNIEGEFISFKYKDYKHLDFYGKPIIKELTLHYTDFFPRLLQHVPLPYFRLVRYYGSYSARSKAVINKRYESLKAQKESLYAKVEDDVYEVPDNPKVCKNCEMEKTYLYSSFINAKGERIYMTRFNLKKENDKPDQNAA